MNQSFIFVSKSILSLFFLKMWYSKSNTFCMSLLLQVTTSRCSRQERVESLHFTFAGSSRARYDLHINYQVNIHSLLCTEYNLIEKLCFFNMVTDFVVIKEKLKIVSQNQDLPSPRPSGFLFFFTKQNILLGKFSWSSPKKKI